MKKIILILACFCFVAINPIVAQTGNEAKTVQTEEKVHACCKAKGGADNCCKKGMSPEKKQCSKKNCQGNCCKNKDADAPACCKAKGGAENCCKKGLSAENTTKCGKDKSQCDKTKCDKTKCATSCNKTGGEAEKKSWWKIW